MPPHPTADAQTVNIRLPRDLHEACIARSVVEDRTLAATIRTALRYYLAAMQISDSSTCEWKCGFRHPHPSHPCGFPLDAAERITVPNCDLCGRVQTEMGGLMFSPYTAAGLVVKKHVCCSCYERIVDDAAFRADTGIAEMVGLCDDPLGGEWSYHNGLHPRLKTCRDWTSLADGDTGG